MNLNHLSTFLAVAKREGISKALEEVALTQSAVSRQIQNLEEAFGVKLFLRKGRSVVLTEAGQVLRDYTIRAFQLLAEAREAIDGLKGLVRGQLRISAASTIGIYLLPEVLGRFKVRYPGIEISLSITNKEQVLRHLLAASTDLGFVGPPVRLPELATDEYMEDELLLIVSPLHRLANREVVPAQELSEDVFILRERGSGTREIMEEELRRTGISLRHAMELGSTEAVKQAVAANLGVSIVSTYAVTQEVMLGRLCTVRISDLNLRRRLYLVYPRNMPLSPAAQAFRTFLLERQLPAEGGEDRSAVARPGERDPRLHGPPQRRPRKARPRTRSASPGSASRGPGE